MIKNQMGKELFQIFFDDYHVGGYVELGKLEKNGTLKGLLKVVYFGLKTKHTPLLQYLFPVGFGPSSKI